MGHFGHVRGSFVRETYERDSAARDSDERDAGARGSNVCDSAREALCTDAEFFVSSLKP